MYHVVAPGTDGRDPIEPPSHSIVFRNEIIACHLGEERSDVSTRALIYLMCLVRGAADEDLMSPLNQTEKLDTGLK